MAEQNYCKFKDPCPDCGAHNPFQCHTLILPKCAVCGILDQTNFGGRFLHMYLTKDEILCSPCIDWAVDYPADLQMHNAIKDNRKFWLGS